MSTRGLQGKVWSQWIGKKRVDRCKILLEKLKKKPRDVTIIFSDETPFSLEEMVASDTGYYLAESKGARDDVVHVR